MFKFPARRLLAAALCIAVSSTTALAAEQPLRLTGAQSGEPVALASDFIETEAKRYGLSPGDTEHRLSSVVPTRHNGVTHVYLQQTVEGIDVDGAITTVNVMADGAILSVGQTFVDSAKTRSNALQPAIGAEMAYSLAASYFNLPLAHAPQAVGGRGGSARHTLFAGGALSKQPVPVTLLLVREGDQLRLAWNLTIDRFDEETFHGELRIDAETGQVIDFASYVAHYEHAQSTKALGDSVGYSASYYVFPMPFESPSHPGAALALVSNPFDPQASPRGWHDTRALGSTGFEFASTRGNNVTARADLTSTNATSNFLAPAQIVGGDLQFNQQWDPNAQPTQGGNQPSLGNVPPALVNLFYWNNILHDVLWRYGFDEPAGNFQVNNFGRGGLGNDGVNADALDGSDLAIPNTNNANFGTPPDGTAPRMQMFRWLGPIVVRVSAPFQADFEARKAGFGQALDSQLSGGFALVNDGGINNGVEGCVALTNAAAVAGKIALVRRGTCEFGLKALNAQNAGALGTVIFNNQGGDVVLSPGGGAVGAQVTTPVAFIGENSGNQLAASLSAGQAAGALVPASLIGPDRDSDFDAGIIGHEYAHGLSNRLTGGPAASTCLNNAEQAGEGWSDFIGMMVTMPENACPTQRSIGTYPSFQAPNGPGIRRFPYARDRAINPFTFADSNDPLQSQPHGVGAVWATMLWDMTCDLVDRHGFDADLVNGVGGNNISTQLVIDGMKLQACRPSFVQARDAILAADTANNTGSDRCLIWQSFAGRGLGVSADSGLNTDRADQREAFDLPENCADLRVSLALEGQGTVFPAAAQFAAVGTQVQYQLVPAAGFRIGSASGCEGALVDGRFRTGELLDDCTVSVRFVQIPTEIFADGFEDRGSL
jgi:hypothetical protein